MYDSREKASLDFESGLIDAREEGREEGVSLGIEKGRDLGLMEGEIKLIRTLQEILGIPLSDESALKYKTLESLQQMTANLRGQLRNRS